MNARPQLDPSDANLSTFEFDAWGFLRRRIWLIVIFTLVGAAVAAYCIRFFPPVFQSSMAILVSPHGPDIMSDRASPTREEMTIADEILATHCDLLGSTRVISDALDASGIGLSASTVTENLSIGRGGSGASKNSSVIRAHYQDSDPARAASVLQAIYESYHTYLAYQAKQSNDKALLSMVSAQQKRHSELKDADERYREYLRTNQLLMLDSGNGSGERVDIHQLRLANIENELAGVRSLIAETQARRSVIEEYLVSHGAHSVTKSDIYSLLTEKEVERLRGIVTISEDDRHIAHAVSSESTRVEYERLLELLTEERILQIEVGDAHPSLTAVRSQIKMVREYLEGAQNQGLGAGRVSTLAAPHELLTGYAQLLANDLAAFRGREQALIDLSAKEGALAKEAELSRLRGDLLRIELDQAQARHQDFSDRLQEVDLHRDYHNFATSLIQSPAIAMEPEWPTLPKLAALGGFSGCLLGLLLGMALEFSEQTFRNPGDVERAASAKVLIHIPRLKAWKRTRRHVGNGIDSSVITHHAPRTVISDTVRLLRTEVLSNLKLNGGRTIMITSPCPADGKTTIAANLAVSMAQAGKRVLLVDGDMRRPSVAQIFGLAAAPGLSDYLKNHCDLEGCCHDSAQHNLAICPEGKPTSYPAELLESPRFSQFSADARERFDVVIIDTPPLLAVADPAIIAGHVDGCLLTIRIKRNQRNLVLQACESLKNRRATLMGVIVNSNRSRSRPYHYSAFNFHSRKQQGRIVGYQARYVAQDEERGSFTDHPATEAPPRLRLPTPQPDATLHSSNAKV
jgi:capsular exopolysaccharide synthesis family protein